MRYILRPHHLVNLKQYAEDPFGETIGNSTEEFNYGLECLLIEGDIFDDVLAGRADVELSVGYDNICSPYCRAKRQGGCFFSDGETNVIIPLEEIEEEDERILSEFGLESGRLYSSKEILRALGLEWYVI